MFGKPEWFRKTERFWQIAPAGWRGWAYVAVWGLVLVVPFAVLLAARRGPEACIWLMAAVAGLGWDVRQVLAQMHAPSRDSQVLYIDDPEDDGSPVKTPNYDLHLRA